MFGIDETFLTRIIGLAFVAVWLAARIGLWKRWYWRSPRSVYPYLPIGLVFLLYPQYEAARASSGADPTVYLVILIVLGVVAVWWMLNPPALVKPEWVRWIEKHPKSTYEAMRKLVRQGAAWQEHIKDEISVDRWAKRVKRAK